LMQATQTTPEIAAEKTAMSDAELAAWLLVKINRRPLARSLPALKGFLTAVVVGPSLPNPFIPIFAALGLASDAYEDASSPEFAALSAAVVHYNRIATILSERPADFEPCFTAKPGGGVDPRPWCQGFYSAVELSRKPWRPLLDLNNHLHRLLLPIFIYCKDKKGRPVLGPLRPGPETATFIEDEAHKDIASMVAAIREHHHTTWYDKPVPADHSTG
jgi:uncharacterized protein